MPATNPGELPNTPAIELWDRQTVLKFFGGRRPLHLSTLYRGVGTIYPRPVYVSANAVRWLRSECEAALDRMIAARDEPKPPQRRGRPRRNIII
jgi:predicted DNA-binding transcriptional regulator AlpA